MKTFGNILCVAASAEEPGSALERAVTLAAQHQARLTVLLVLEEIAPNIAPFAAGNLHELRAALQDVAIETLEQSVADARSRVELETKVVFGKPFLAIIREAMRANCDVVVKGAEGEGGGTSLFGRTDRRLLRKCPCPVLIVKPSDQPPCRRVLAAVDFDPADVRASEIFINRQILDLAASLAINASAELHVVHVWESLSPDVLRTWSRTATDASIAAYVESERQRHSDGLNQLMSNFRLWLDSEARSRLSPQSHLLRGAAQEKVPALTRELSADLLVMGTVARTGVPGLLIGNTAETILDKIDCSVLAIKPQGFVSPVTLGE